MRYDDFIRAQRECYFITGNQYREIGQTTEGGQTPAPYIEQALGGGFRLLVNGQDVLTPALAGSRTRDPKTKQQIYYTYEQGVRNDDQVQFILSSLQPGYIYLLYRGTSGGYSLLFPNQQGSIRYSAYFPYQNAATSFPQGDQSLEVSGTPGMEYLYLLLSTVPLDPEQIARKLARSQDPAQHFDNLKAALSPISVVERSDMTLNPDKIECSAKYEGDFVLPIIIA